MTSPPVIRRFVPRWYHHGAFSRTVALALAFGTMGDIAGCSDAAPRENELFQEKLAQRPDQTATSSKAACYCFPNGPECHYGGPIGGPQQAPTDVPPCVEGEACDASSSWYLDGFERPRGHCRRLCFHNASELPPEVTTEEFAPYLGMDCAPGEECILEEIDRGFEGIPRGSVGLCIVPPPHVL